MEVMRYSGPKSTYAVQCIFAHNFITPTFLQEQKTKPELTKRIEGTSGELHELEKQFPEPALQEILPDCRWIEENWMSPEMARYRGTTIAVYNGAIVGHGDDSLQLELDLARKFGVHPARFVIVSLPRALEW